MVAPNYPMLTILDLPRRNLYAPVWGFRPDARGVIVPMRLFFILPAGRITISACWRAREGESMDACDASWSEWRDSNPRPHGPEPCALPAALHPDGFPWAFVGCPERTCVPRAARRGRPHGCGARGHASPQSRVPAANGGLFPDVRMSSSGPCPLLFGGPISCARLLLTRQGARLPSARDGLAARRFLPAPLIDVMGVCSS